jgi:hypothetical protein
MARNFHFYQAYNVRLAPVDKKNRRAGAAEATLKTRRARLGICGGGAAYAGIQAQVRESHGDRILKTRQPRH